MQEQFAAPTPRARHASSRHPLRSIGVTTAFSPAKKRRILMAARSFAVRT